MKNTQIQEYLDDLMVVYSELSTWEKGFVDSISEQYEEKNFLTDKQKDKLESIWDEKT
jgi:hypothetical protein